MESDDAFFFNTTFSFELLEVDGEHLKLCWDADAKTNGRPKKFAADNTKDRLINLVLKREAKQ